MKYLKHQQNNNLLLKNLCTIGILVFCFASCAPVYLPNISNVPFMKNKGETHISGSVGVPAVQLQGAYSIANHFYFMVNGSGALLLSRSFFGEAGIGFFQSFGQKGILNCSAGYGIGTAESQYKDGGIMGGIFSGNTHYFQGNFNRYFIQPSLGFLTTNSEIGFSFRNSIVRFPEYTERVGGINRVDTFQNQEGFFGEPAIFIRSGNEKLKGFGQFGVTLPYNYHSFEPHHLPYFFSFGINMKLGNSKI